MKFKFYNSQLSLNNHFPLEATFYSQSNTVLKIILQVTTCAWLNIFFSDNHIQHVLLVKQYYNLLEESYFP